MCVTKYSVYVPQGTNAPSPGPSPFPQAKLTLQLVDNSSNSNLTSKCMVAECLNLHCKLKVQSCTNPANIQSQFVLGSSMKTTHKNILRVAFPTKSDEQNTFVRHDPPKGDCESGTEMQLGECTDEVFAFWDNSTSQIKSNNCKDMCIGVEYSNLSMVLRPCQSAATWILDEL